ncbi:expressed unknown protein [Seminavis robusta]|uniref:SnoaL-like domain-containing protein n=1 Tax=Seminavis robusta TaxID=568900 RepID=A0A9N8EHW8_9STRA|nr:expressed unknown protein [Seminavis robusta]|eukprot:Sro1126_g244080.1 n/a (179) ;mRNA; f:18380-18916
MKLFRTATFGLALTIFCLGMTTCSSFATTRADHRTKDITAKSSVASSQAATTTTITNTMTYDLASTLAKEWIAAWNRRETMDSFLDSRLDDNVELISPFVPKLTGQQSLQGRDSLKQYFVAVLEKYPKLHFELQDVLTGKDSVALYYRSVNNAKECVVMFVNEQGQIYKLINHSRPCG